MECPFNVGLKWRHEDRWEEQHDVVEDWIKKGLLLLFKWLISHIQTNQDT